MPRQFLRRHLPSPERLRATRGLGRFGAWLARPELWHLNRRSISGAVFNGLFCALLPMPLQILPAFWLAVTCRWNLPLSLTLVWINNPLTYAPVFFFTYQVGATLLGQPVVWPEAVTTDWLLGQLGPLWLGSLTCGLVLGTLGWGVSRLLWRLSVVRAYRRRAARLPRVPESGG